MAIHDDFKSALSSWASGVSVVTVNSGGLLYGLTVSSFTSVSLDPPMVLVCIGTDNRWHRMAEEAGQFAVSILSRDQEAASNYFAIPGREPTPGFVKIPGEWTEAGVPVIEDAMAYVLCKHVESIERGDHTIVLGEVFEAVTRDAEAEPLVYFRRAYRGVKPASIED